MIAAELARLGSTVVIVSRGAAAGEQLKRQIAAQAGADRAEVIAGDLSTREGVRQVAGEFAARHDRLHLLVNNAGAHYRKRRVNADGVEMHVAVDYLAGFGLTLLLLGQLRAGAPSRVVNVVSDAMNDARVITSRARPRPVTLDPGELDDLRRINGTAGFAPFEAYARAKLLTTMSGYLLARELRDTGVTVNAVHPGITATRIAGDTAPPRDEALPRTAQAVHAHPRTGRRPDPAPGDRTGTGRHHRPLLRARHRTALAGDLLRPRPPAPPAGRKRLPHRHGPRP